MAALFNICASSLDYMYLKWPLYQSWLRFMWGIEANSNLTFHQKFIKFETERRLIDSNNHTKFDQNQMKTVVFILPTTNVDKRTNRRMDGPKFELDRCLINFKAYTKFHQNSFITVASTAATIKFWRDIFKSRALTQKPFIENSSNPNLTTVLSIPMLTPSFIKIQRKL